jgi:hypothetical protein
VNEETALHAMRSLQRKLSCSGLLPRVNEDPEVSKYAGSSSYADFVNALDKFIVPITSTIFF